MSIDLRINDMNKGANLSYVVHIVLGNPNFDTARDCEHTSVSIVKIPDTLAMQGNIFRCGE